MIELTIKNKPRPTSCSAIVYRAKCLSTLLLCIQDYDIKNTSA